MSSSADSVDVVPSLLRKMNVRTVLETFQLHGPCTRAQLNRRTGISPPTVSKLIAQLLEAGLVEQDQDPVVTQGRPGILFRLASDRVHVIAGVIDVNECTVVTSGLDGDIKTGSERRFPTPGNSRALMKQLETHLGMHIDQHGAAHLSIGLTIPGLINRKSGQVIFSPNMHFLDGKAPGKVLSERLGIEAISLQEENALCLGEQMFGQARGVSDFAVIDLSQGFGMGVVSAGRFLTGRLGYGGEIGHITVDPQGKLCGCGNRGCLETVATDRALAAGCSEKIGRSVGIDEVIRLVKEEDMDPGPVLERTIEYVAIGVGAVINIFNPQRVLLHGRMFDMQADLLDRVIERSRARALGPCASGCDIRRTQANKAVGAVAGVIDHLFSRLGPSLNSF